MNRKRSKKLISLITVINVLLTGCSNNSSQSETIVDDADKYVDIFYDDSRVIIMK